MVETFNYLVTYLLNFISYIPSNFSLIDMYKKLKFKIQTKILIQKKLFKPQRVLLC